MFENIRFTVEMQQEDQRKAQEKLIMITLISTFLKVFEITQNIANLHWILELTSKHLKCCSWGRKKLYQNLIGTQRLFPQQAKLLKEKRKSKVMKKKVIFVHFFIQIVSDYFCGFCRFRKIHFLEKLSSRLCQS